MTLISIAHNPALIFSQNIRPPLKLNPEKHTLHITLTSFKCRGLKPVESLVNNDLDTYLKFRCEPLLLEKKYNNGEKRTDTIKTSDRPLWPREEITFQINVSSEEDILGAFLYIECIHEHVLSSDSVLGTIVIDLEHMIRRSLGVTEWNNEVERQFLRNGKEVGKICCKMSLCWGKSPRSHQRPRVKPIVVPPSSSHGSAQSAERTSRIETPEKSLSHYLTKLALPHGLLSTVLRNYQSCEKRYWYIDNSASMKTRDSRLMGDSLESVQVASRWEELCECVCFHAKFSAKCGLTTTFFLMNPPSLSAGPHQFSVSRSQSEIDEEKRIMTAATPKASSSPLIQCVSDFKKLISSEASQLSSKGKHVTLVMCTQGLPTDQTGAAELAALRQFKHSIYALSKLPVKIVIRLCTDDEKTMRVYNALDNRLDNVDVLDDYWGEVSQ